MTAVNELNKAYEPQELESHWYAVWEKAGYFAPQAGGPAYCIMLPPPNITGSLHLGHALETSIIDALIRFHRMQGNTTLWQGGTDHASIATEMIVTKRLAAEGVEKQSLGRDAFIEKVWEWKAESGGNISRQLRRLGASVDWSRECFTLDEGISRATMDVFVRLYDEGLIYRGTRLVNWDPVLRTAVSDLEAIATEEAGEIWHIRYPLTNGQGHVIVATTRPETLLGDVAVAVHPTDSRYQHLIGQQVILPLTGRTIPVIADEFVEAEFGSGCVKITPAHDFNDYAVGIRHDLEPINILTETATLNDTVPEAYRGLSWLDARKKIVAELDAQGLLAKIEPHVAKIPRGEKSGAVLQPYLTNQWFVRIESLAKPAIEAVEKGHIKFIPENCQNIYFAWMRNIQDWCISRQLWWGHRIPAWYDKEGNVYVAQDEAEARDKYEIDDTIELTQDTDVLDTWFSASLWPFATLGWPDETPEYKTFYPTNVLITGFDIIFFWVARMIMMGLKFTGQVPFKEVYIHGLIRDGKGQKNV